MDAARDVVPRKSVDGTKANGSENPSISLVLPAYNEQAVIEQAIREADEALSDLTDDYEILVVDDGSTDQTRAVAEQEAQRRPAVRVISFAENQGYGAALRTGFQAATKEWIGFTDSDCQFDVRELNRLTLLLEKHDVACGYRIDRQDSWLRCLYSKVYNGLVSLLLNTGVRDCDCALKLFRRDVLESLPLDTDGFLVNAELLTKARLTGKSVVEVGVTHRERPRGTSTVSVWHTIPVFQALIRFWWSAILFPASGNNEKTADGYWSRSRTATAAAALVFLSVIMFFWNLSYPLIEPDESRYAQISLEMVQSGDYVVPRLHGKAYLDKPPLLYWATAAGLKTFGINEVAARLPSALAAVLTIFATFWLGRLLVGNRAAFIAAIMLFLCLGFVLSGRFLIMDGLLALFTTVGILASCAAARAAPVRLHWWLLAAAACALGILTKGPVAIVLILPPLIVTLWMTRWYRNLRVGHWVAFAATATLIAVPWFALIASREPDFLAYFFWKHHVLRFVHAFDHQEPFWYYIPVLFVGMFPSSLLLSPTVIFLFSRSESIRHRRTPELGAIIVGAFWVIVFFSISSCKLPTYILPAVPLLCLVQACAFEALVDHASPITYFRKLAVHLPIWATGLALAIGIGFAIADLWLRFEVRSLWSLDTVVILGAGATLTFMMFWRQRKRQLRVAVENTTASAPLSLGAGQTRVHGARMSQHETRKPFQFNSWAIASTVSIVIMLFGFQRFMPELARYRSINANAASMHVATGRMPLPVVYFDRRCDAASFHMASQDFRHFEPDQLAEFKRFLLQHSHVVLVADRQRVDELRATFGNAIDLTATNRGLGRLYVLTSRPDILVSMRTATRLQ